MGGVKPCSMFWQWMTDVNGGYYIIYLTSVPQCFFSTDTTIKSTMLIAIVVF